MSLSPSVNCDAAKMYMIDKRIIMKQTKKKVTVFPSKDGAKIHCSAPLNDTSRLFVCHLNADQWRERELFIYALCKRSTKYMQEARRGSWRSRWQLNAAHPSVIVLESLFRQLTTHQHNKEHVLLRKTKHTFSQPGKKRRQKNIILVKNNLRGSELIWGARTINHWVLE